MTQHNNLSLNQQSKDVAQLQGRLINIGYTIATSEILSELFGQSTYQAVLHFQQREGLRPTGVVDVATAQAIANRFESDKTIIAPKPLEVVRTPTPTPAQWQQAIPAREPPGFVNAVQQARAEMLYTVEGVVASPDRAVTSGLRVQLVDKNVGPDLPLVETFTDKRGHYQASFSSTLFNQAKAHPDLQARVSVGQTSGQTFLAASQVRYDATMHEILNVKLPANATALPSEYETLTTTLGMHYKGSLGNLQETREQQDITYLANKTGWDARAVAFAALADQFSQSRAGTAKGTDAGSIQPAFYYALFRAGLPANAETLYRADPRRVEAIWKQAIEQGMIPHTLEPEIGSATQTFLALSAAGLLDARSSIGISTYKELLQLTLGTNPQSQQRFADLYVRYQDDLPTFWRTLEQEFGTATTKRLQLDGQLGYLTLNHAPLIARLHDAERTNPLTSMLDLAQRGYYQAAQWNQLLAGESIPPLIPGSTIDEQRANYAELLAAQVRVAFPTAVVADLVKRNLVPILGGVQVQNALSSFLTLNQGKFEIGVEPIEHYLARTHLTSSVDASVVEQVKRLQRVYQLTPTDQAFSALLQLNLDSAYQITRYDEPAFVRSFQQELGGEGIASQVYARAQQVYGVLINLVSSYLTARRAPLLGSSSDAILLDPNLPAKLEGAIVAASPTLEELFGSMDYCACDECRSILSPAAYLVDLLQFIDCPSPQKQNPQTVLFNRRPDIQYLPLTCENTNIALPYIDLVNETLEYFVAHGLSLTGYTGNTTDGTITSDELLANPQFVEDVVYNLTLKKTPFPPPLPFHRSLELLRLHFQKFGVHLQDAMIALRSADVLERGSAVYGWRDILMEQLGLSRVEYLLLTDSTLTLQQLYGYPTLSDAEVITELSSFQNFSRRVGVSYEDLISILQTLFINPYSVLIPRLERLGVPFTTLRDLKDGAITDAAFRALLPVKLNLAEYSGDVVAWVKNPANYAHMMSLITLANPTDSTDTCSVADLQFRYSNPDNKANILRAFDFVRLLRFIRLWRKLGLTIQQTDEIITALYPLADLPTGTNQATNLQRLDAGFLVLLPRVGFAFQVMNQLQLTADQDLASLLACWAPIGVAGQDSLYRAMFLTPTLLQEDLVFADDGYGNFLQQRGQTMFGHEPALRAALNLTDAEFTLITGSLGFDATTALTLANISAVYRRGWLARKLELSVVEFLLLTSLTGLDPFAQPDLQAAPPVEPPMVQFVRLVQALRSANLKPVQALYLIWNEGLSGLSAPSEADITGLARTLRADCAAVESQFVLLDDPNGDIARALMTLVYGTDAANFFFGLLNNTLAVATPYANPQPTLAQAVLDVASGRLSYDDLRKQLIYTGVLDAATLSALTGVIGANAPLQAALAALSAANHTVVDPFFATYPELLPLYAAYVASNDPPQMKRTTLLANFLPDLKRRRKQEQALDAVTAATGVDGSFAPALLDNATALHAAADNTLACINDFTAVEAPGLSVQFFLTNNPSAAPDLTLESVPVFSYTPNGPNKLPAGQGGGPIAGIWSGYLDVTQDGFYNISVAADPGATVALEIAGAPVVMAQNGSVWSNQSPIALTAGSLSAITLTATTLIKTLTVSWQSTGLGWQVIPGSYLYSATLVERLRTSYVRFLKATSLATTLALTANEIAYLATNGDFQVNGQGWLNTLPVIGQPDMPTSASLRAVLVLLLQFARLKAALSPNDERLLAILESPAAALPNGQSALLALTGWEQESVDALLSQFFASPQLAPLMHLENFRRVYDAYAIVTTCGISAAALIAATTNDPEDATVSALQAALRALYAKADWLAVVRPINDTMRVLQRDALVAYILQQLGDQPATSAINTADALFEYFLMDVQMEPCMQTSRIRHALSSVQLFIEHCLRNLELSVAASDISAVQWEWMKRYRVWQANREVFLWPENWLEPDLRNDQSSFFADLLSELLQSDITDDTAATAFLNYLTKLEEVAKLEQCGIYHIPGDADQTGEVVHMVARTAGAHRKYYYRRFESSTWKPWEEIKLDIEDTPVIPVVWNDRLLLFWLQILKQAQIDPTQTPAPSTDQTPLTQLTMGQLQGDTRANAMTQSRVTIQAALCWSEYYNGKWQPAKTSDVNRPTTIGFYSPAGVNAFDRSQLGLRAAPLTGLPTDTLLVDIKTGDEFDLFGLEGPGFVLYNTHSLPLRVEDVVFPSFTLPSNLRLIPFMYPNKDSSQFSIFYISTTNGLGVSEILQTPIGERVTEPQPDVPDIMEAPFTFEDSRNVFYVTTSEALVSIGEYTNYGLPNQVSTLPPGLTPPIVVQQPGGIPDNIGPVSTPLTPGLGDPAAMQLFVSEDANIRVALGTTAQVQYGNLEIGPQGSLP